MARRHEREYRDVTRSDGSGSRPVVRDPHTHYDGEGGMDVRYEDRKTYLANLAKLARLHGGG